VETLRRSGRARGFAVEAVPPCVAGGAPVSSTRVRAALAAGRLDEARALLGRDFRISGRVAEGKKLGRTLGFPTANLRLFRRVSPVAGIYAVRVWGAGLARHPGVASVGTRPTVGGTEWLLEVHLFDYAGGLYGERLDVDFVAWLREEIRFDDLAAMTARMRDDTRRARALLAA
jgi:riboflavin kinase/FMN adenylyltransferase